MILFHYSLRLVILVAIGLLLVAEPPIALAQATSSPDSSLDEPTARSEQDIAAPAPAQCQDSWLYRGSDIPCDSAWSFGVLDNGLRYAVRHNDVPAGQVAIRVRIDAGVLVENDNQRGVAHLLEHLAFRGSTLLPDGDLKRTWQRLGVSIGGDNNAYTTPTQTVYQLDLPSASDANLQQAMRLLAGMIRSPRMDEAAVAAERAVVLSELRESQGPLKRVNDAVTKHFFAGQRLATRPTIGTEESLAKVTVADVRQFHRDWYRPSRAHIIMVGDASPTQMQELIEQYFADWTNDSPEPAPFDLGVPDPSAPPTAFFYEAGQPLYLSLAAIRPYRYATDTIAYTHQLYIDYLAMLILNRRLEVRARRGGSYLSASAEPDKVSRSADITTVQILPTDNRWQAALADVRGIIADALATAPSEQDIQREADEVAAFLDKQLKNARNAPGAELANDMILAIDIGEVVASRTEHVRLFAGARAKATPAAILAATRRLFSAPVTRLIAAGGARIERTALQQALDTSVAADTSARLSNRQLSFADLPALGEAGEIVSQTNDNAIGAEILTFANGAKAFVVDNKVEPDKVRVNVRFGGGYIGGHASQGQGQNTSGSLLWSGDYALLASGIGDLRQEDIEQLTNGRQIQLQFSIDEDAFELSAETNPSDLADQLRLIATKLAHPGWDTAPVERLKAALLNELSLSQATPNAILERELIGWLRDGDPRWKAPTQAEIEALTPTKFREFWSKQLAQGAIEVQIFGDLSTVDYQQILAETIGALPPRPPLATSATVRFPKPLADRKRVYHKGDGKQAAALIAWRTGSGLADYQQMVRLSVLEAIVNNRIFNRLRAAEGASYAPFVASQWPLLRDSSGYFLVASLLSVDNIDLFYDIVDETIADLRSQAVDEDERRRATAPIIEQINRAMSGNVFWMYVLEGATQEPRLITHALTIQRDIAAVTAEDLLTTAQLYFAPDKSWSLVLLPEEKTAIESEKAK